MRGIGHPPCVGPRRAFLLAGAGVLLASCAERGPGGRPYHAFELGISKAAGELRHFRWQYGDVGPNEAPVKVGTGRAFMLHRQAMPVPAFFEASWQSAQGDWYRVRLPVRDPIARPVAGHSVLVMIDPTEVWGALVTYTARGDVEEIFTRARPATVSAAEAAAVGR